MHTVALMGNREGEALWSGRDGKPCGAKGVLAEWPCLLPLPGTVISGWAQGVGSVHVGHCSDPTETKGLLATTPRALLGRVKELLPSGTLVSDQAPRATAIGTFMDSKMASVS